jgi:carboxyl-terminal processing protease
MKAPSINDPGFRSAAYDVEKILRELKGKKVDGVILDLRGNGGGSLLEARRLTGLFIEAGPIVQVKERGLRALYDRDPTIVYSGPMVVLINRLSASASEILAGALQDYGRAIVVGDSKTHGKGTVQAILELGRETRFGAVRVTTASYFRISGGSTQLKGIAPDIVVPSPFDFMQLGEERLPNAIPWSRVPPAHFAPVADLSALRPVLKTKSQTRRSKDPLFEAYDKLLERVRVVNQAKELSLHIDARRKRAKMEQELSAFQDRLSESEEGRDPKKKNSDLVLLESMRILADLITLQKKLVAPAPKPESRRKSVWQSIMEWLISETGRPAGAEVPAGSGAPSCAAK